MALANATWSGNQIVTVVARSLGIANDTNSRSAVTDYINLGLWDISLQTPWDWNTLQAAADQTVTAGVSDYNLPTATGAVYDSIYDCRLVGANARTLDPIDMRTYDKAQRRIQTYTNIPTHYVVFSAQQSATIRLVPTPSAADTLRIRYIQRQPTIADSTGSSLAIADKFIPLVIFKGCENVATWKNPERVGYFQQKYNQALARAMEMDKVGADTLPGFSPRIEHEIGKIDYLNPDDLTFYPR